MMKLQLEEIAAHWGEHLVQMRRHLHQYPELSGDEVETSAFVQAELGRLEIPYKTGFAKTGVLGILEGGKPGKTVALRADMDALPILEKNEGPVISMRPGVMHACGHDAHTAMLLGAAAILKEYQAELPGRVLFIFQPAEEQVPHGGAQPMMDDGLFDQYLPDVIYGQHVWPDLPVGTIGVKEGAIMANSDGFTITIHGAGGHASMPHQGLDAIVVAAQMINALQTIVSRNINPLEPAVLTIGKITGGYRYNVIADEVVLEGTTRSLDPKVRLLLKERLHQVVEQVAEAMGARATVQFQEGYPVTFNSAHWVEQVRKTAHHLLGTGNTPAIQPSMGGEDFSRFLQRIPGAFFWLGCALPDRPVQKPLHDPQFQLDERVLPIGAGLMAQLVLDTLLSK